MVLTTPEFTLLFPSYHKEEIASPGLLPANRGFW